MKHLHVLFFLLIAAFQKFGKETIYKTKKDKVLDGFYKISSNRGSYSEIHFKEGKIDGVRKDFNSNEELTCKRSYKDGRADGKWEYYDAETNQVKTIENYKNGMKNGKWWKKIRKNGAYYIKTEFYKDDIPTGKWTEKWENSPIMIEERTYTGKGSYTKKEYDKGILYKKEKYKNFKFDGEQVVYFKSGKIMEKELYKDGVKEKAEAFFEDGSPRVIRNFKNGRPHGKQIDYRSPGLLSSEEYYENGKKEGVFKIYSSSGKLYFLNTYKNDAQTGLHQSYSVPDGLLEKEGQFLNDSRNGVWKFYDTQGKLSKEVTYKLGHVVSEKEF